MRDRLRGVFTALATPFTEDGRLDEEAYRRLVTRQLDAGVNGLVPCGTTGEAPALELEEWETLVGIAVDAADGRVPVVPGTGTNNTGKTVARTRRARELGADAALVVTPYYNKPNTEGLVAHYRTVAEQGGLPVVVYNVPSRTGRNVAPPELMRIAGIDGVVAVKEAAGNLVQAQQIVRQRPETLAVLSGEDPVTCAMVLLGADGVISVVSNVDPAGTVRMVEAASKGDANSARGEHYRLEPLVEALFAETNPVPVKKALSLLGLCGETMRPPLAPASDATTSTLREALAPLGIQG
jgi:4-hydroxy-tetrahydrodipicolinate synthase